MSTPEDLDDARVILLGLLEVDAEIADAIADAFEAAFGRQALAQPRDTVLRAAIWAAELVNAMPADERARLSPQRVLALVRRDDCPLCASGSDDGGGDGGATRTPIGAPPLRVPVYDPA